MNAESARQLRLLDLQAIDTRLDQIAHARTHLPQLAELADLLGKARLIDDQLVRSRTELGDVQREVAKAESDVQLVRDRAARDQARLDAGTGSAKDLQALQHELTSLARRQSELEDIELEVMERAEAAESDVAELERGRGELTTRIDGARGRPRRGVRPARRRGRRHRRPPPDRRRRGRRRPGRPLREDPRRPTAAPGPPRCASAAAAAASSSSTRSRSSASASAPEDEVLRCEECRRILVRTAESGL